MAVKVQRLQRLRTEHQALMYRISQLGFESISWDRLKSPVLDDQRYPDFPVNKLAAVHMVRTGQCTAAEAAELLDVTTSSINAALLKTERVQTYWKRYEYGLSICLESDNSAELARRALEAGLMDRTRDHILHRVLLAAQVRPSEWVVVLAVHPVDGPLGLAARLVQPEGMGKAVFDSGEKIYDKLDMASKSHLEERMQRKLDRVSKERREVLTMLYSLAPLRHQPTT